MVAGKARGSEGEVEYSLKVGWPKSCLLCEAHSM